MVAQVCTNGVPLTPFLAFAYLSLFITTIFQKVAVKCLVLLKFSSSPAEKGVWAAGGMEKAAVTLVMKAPLIQREP